MRRGVWRARAGWESACLQRASCSNSNVRTDILHLYLLAQMLVRMLSGTLFKFNRGIFFRFFSTLFITAFICRHSDSTVLEGAGIEPRIDATTALAFTFRRSNHSARSQRHFKFIRENLLGVARETERVVLFLHYMAFRNLAIKYETIEEH
jgi:hypothetical protein